MNAVVRGVVEQNDIKGDLVKDREEAGGRIRQKEGQNGFRIHQVQERNLERLEIHLTQGLDPLAIHTHTLLVDVCHKKVAELAHNRAPHILCSDPTRDTVRLDVTHLLQRQLIGHGLVVHVLCLVIVPSPTPLSKHAIIALIIALQERWRPTTHAPHTLSTITPRHTHLGQLARGGIHILKLAFIVHAHLLVRIQLRIRTVVCHHSIVEQVFALCLVQLVVVVQPTRRLVRQVGEGARRRRRRHDRRVLMTRFTRTRFVPRRRGVQRTSRRRAPALAVRRVSL